MAAWAATAPSSAKSPRRRGGARAAGAITAMGLPAFAALGAALLGALMTIPSVDAQAPPTTPFADLSDWGWLPDIYVGADLGCQVHRVQWAGPGVPRFDPQGARPADCGTFLAVNGTLYRPDFLRHQGGSTALASMPTATPFQQVWQSARTGDGIATPWQITTSVWAEFGRINITQTDYYDGGADYYFTHIQVRNIGPAAMPFLLYRAGDCASAPSPGWGATGLSQPGSIACVQNLANPWQDNFTEWIPWTSARYYENRTAPVWQWIASQTAFPNACDCAQFGDNGAGLQWDGVLAPGGGSFSAWHATRFYVPPPPSPPPPPPPGNATADFVWWQDDCTNTMAWFQDASTPSSGAVIVQSTWDWGDASPPQTFPGNPTVFHTYPAYGSYLVTLTITDSNQRTASVSKTILLEPCLVADFTWAPPIPCDYQPVTFTDLSYATSPRYLTQSEWDFGDGSPLVTLNPWASTTNHVYTAPGVYTVTLTVYDNQSHSDTASQDITVVNCRPTVDFEWLPDPPCAWEPVTFEDLSAAMAPWSLANSRWEFGDATVANLNPWQQFVTHTYTWPGVYDVNLTVWDSAGRSNTSSLAIGVVNCPPIAVFTWTPFPEPCNGEPVIFDDQSVAGPNSTLDRSFWEWGDSQTTAVNPWTQFVVHTYANPGVYVVNLTVWDNHNRSTTWSDSITILDCNPIADFNWTPLVPCHLEPVTFYDNSLTFGGGVPDQMTWDFGDGTVWGPMPWAPSVTYAYPLPGTYTVVYTFQDNYGRSNTTSKDITVIDCTPWVDFDWSPNPVCDLETVWFTDQTSSWFSLAWENWTFGDGNSSSGPFDGVESHAYGSSGTYVVTYTVTDIHGRTNTTMKVITVDDCRPTADFEWEPVPACMGKPTKFRDLSFAQAPWQLSISTWRFGDGSQHGPRAWQFEVWHTFASFTNYTVNLTVEDTAGRQMWAEKVVAVVPCPDAFFRCWTPERPYRRVHFYDQSTNRIGIIVNWTYDFGDSTFGYQRFMWHDYPSMGDWTVTLTATNQYGGVGTFTRVCRANDNRPPVIDPVPTRYVYEGEELVFQVTGSDPDGDALIFLWDEGPLYGKGATFNANGWFRWRPAIGMAGHYGPLLFRVTDGEYYNSTLSSIVVVPLPVGMDRGSGAAARDADGDGIADAVDLCPNVPDPDQRDTDGDRIGDACDEPPPRPTPPAECDGSIGLARDVSLRSNGQGGVELIWGAATGCAIEVYLIWEGDGTRLLGFVEHDPDRALYAFEETAPLPGDRTYRIQSVGLDEPWVYVEERTVLAGSLNLPCRTCERDPTANDAPFEPHPLPSGKRAAAQGGWGWVWAAGSLLLVALGALAAVVIVRRRSAKESPSPFR